MSDSDGDIGSQAPDQGDQDPLVDLDDVAKVSLEAQSLLQYYLPDIFGAKPEDHSSQSHFQFASTSRSPPSGIKLPQEFHEQFSEIQKESDLIKALPRGASSAFIFSREDQTAFFETERHSSELLNLASSLGFPNFVSGFPFKYEDKIWKNISDGSRKASAIAVYIAGLAFILARADELQLSEQDRINIPAFIGRLSLMQFSISARASCNASRKRRRLVLNALKLDSKSSTFLEPEVPVQGPYLFGGQLHQGLDRGIDQAKRAEDLAPKLKKLSSSSSSSSSNYRPPRQSYFSFRGSRGGWFNSRNSHRGGGSGRPYYRNQGGRQDSRRGNFSKNNNNTSNHSNRGSSRRDSRNQSGRGRQGNRRF